MYQNTRAPPLLTPSVISLVQMLTFPPLTSISTSLGPAVRSSNNSSDRRATAKALVPSILQREGRRDGSVIGRCLSRGLYLESVRSRNWTTMGEAGGLAALGEDRPTCSNSRSYPEEMKTSISAEPCRSRTQDPFHFLAGCLPIYCFHS